MSPYVLNGYNRCPFEYLLWSYFVSFTYPIYLQRPFYCLSSLLLSTRFPSTLLAITKKGVSKENKNRTKTRGIQEKRNDQKKPTLTSSPTFLTPNHGITGLALNPSSPSSHVELTPTAILLPSQLKATAATPPGNFGYCLNRFLTL